MLHKCNNDDDYNSFLQQAEDLVSKFFPQKMEELQMLLKVSGIMSMKSVMGNFWG